MAKKSKKIKVRKGRDFRTSKNTDGLRKSKPSGYRFKGEDKFGKPTKKQIREHLDHERDDIYFENRVERSDKKPFSKRGNRFNKGGGLTDDSYFQVVNHFVYFCLNYPRNFFDAFGEKDSMIRKHIEGKFNSYYEKYGSYGVMVKFWTELDGKNREKLSNWIKENYKGQKLNYEGDTTDIINHFVYFTQNYPNNFMDAFDSEGKNIKEHIQSKFNSYYDKYGSYGVMIKLWVELDRENEKLFAKWIKENYKGILIEYKKGGDVGDLTNEEKVIIDNRIDYYFENNTFTKDVNVLTSFVMDGGEIEHEKLEKVKDYINSQKLSKGGAVGGRGFFGLKKGKKITDINSIKVGDIILGHSKQFNADNTFKIVDRRQYGNTVNFDAVYWNPIENERIGNEDIGISDLNLSWEDFYFPDNHKYEGGGELTKEEIVLSKLNSDGEISCDELEIIIERSPCYPVCSVGELKLRKQFLRGCYKKI